MKSPLIRAVPWLSSGVLFFIALHIGTFPVVLWFLLYISSASIIGAVLSWGTIDGEERRSVPVFWSSSFIIGYPFCMGLVISALWFPATRGIAYWLPPGAALLVFPWFFRRWERMRRIFSSDTPAWILLAAVALIVTPPLSHVGKPVEGGLAYRAYFDHDTLVHLAVAAELSHGHIPPRNPYLARETLHYYWLPFLFPATVYRASHRGIPLEKCLLLTDLVLAVCFVLILYQFISSYVSHRPSAGTAAFVTLVATSFEGVFLLFRLWIDGSPFSDFTRYNIDGLTRWFFGTPQIDSLYRGLLFTPQHLTALSLLCLVFYWFRTFADKPEFPVIPIAVASALITGCSAFIGLIFFTGLAGLIFVSLVRGKWTLRSFNRLILPVTILTILAMGAWFRLEMIVPGTGMFTIGPETLRFEHITPIFLLNLGLPAGLAAWGVILARGRKTGTPLELIAMSVLSLLFIFMFVLQDYENEFGLRGGFAFLTVTAPLSAFVFQRILFRRPGAGIISRIALICIVCSGAVTTLLDGYNLQDIGNPRFTTILPHDYLAPLHWLRNETDAKTIVQAEPESIVAYNRSVPNFIPPFAERCMAVGKAYYAGQFQVGKDPATQEVARIRDLYRSPHAMDLLEAKRDPGIDLWWIGPDEADRYSRDALKKFRDTIVTKCVFDGSRVQIYEPSADSLPPFLLDPERGWSDPACLESLGPDTPPPGNTRRAASPVPFTAISGLEKIQPVHDWIFTAEDIINHPVYLATRNPVFLELSPVTGNEHIRMHLFYIRCQEAPRQSIRVTLGNQIVCCFRLKPGWHWYTLPLERITLPPDKPLRLVLSARRFKTSGDLCGSDFAIGDTGMKAPAALLVRIGPAPRGGVFGDVFWEGGNISPHKKGYNLIPVPPVLPAEVFDITSDPAENLRMVRWIESIPKDTIVCGLTIGCSPSDLSAEGKTALEHLGVRIEDDIQPGALHGFIGVKDAPPGTAPEIYAIQKPEFLFVGPNQGRRAFGFALSEIRDINP